MNIFLPRGENFIKSEKNDDKFKKTRTMFFCLTDVDAIWRELFLNFAICLKIRVVMKIINFYRASWRPLKSAVLSTVFPKVSKREYKASWNEIFNSRRQNWRELISPCHFGWFRMNGILENFSSIIYWKA